MNIRSLVPLICLAAAGCVTPPLARIPGSNIVLPRSDKVDVLAIIGLVRRDSTLGHPCVALPIPVPGTTSTGGPALKCDSQTREPVPDPRVPLRPPR